MTIPRVLVSEEQAKRKLSPLACPKCGNTTASEDGISHWWHVTRTRAVLGTLDGVAVTDTDSEECDFSHTGEPKIQDDGFYCGKCHHEWAVADPLSLDEVVADLGLTATVGCMIRDGWEPLPARGRDIQVGDAVVQGTTVYELNVRPAAGLGRVVCGYGSPGNGGTFSVGEDEEVRLFRRGPARKLPGDVVAFLLHQDGRAQHRLTLSGLRADMEAHYERPSVYAFLDAWTAGRPIADCWHNLRPKPPTG